MKRMSAREELHESLCGSCCGRSALGECEAVNRQIDAFAHELAEEIREHGGTRGDEYFNEAAHVFADLIDPEVKS